jgi:YhcN/YlaJ family sporulation lipoprotein
MMIMRKTAVLLLCLGLSLTGCYNGQQIGLEKGDLQKMSESKSERTPNSQIDSPLVEEKSFETHQSKDLINLIEQANGVENAHVIVTGDYVLVGIEPTANVESGQEDEQVRKEVYDVIKGNSHGRNAAITTDPDKVAKIKGFGKQIKQSKNDLHGGVYNEIGKLIGKIKPLPGHYKSTRRQDQHEQNDQKRDDLYK